MKSIVDWLVEPNPDGALRLYEGRQWVPTGYPSLAREALGAATLMRGTGIRKGDRVAIILPTGLDFVRYFYGMLAMGAIPTVIAPPGLHGTANYPEHVAALLRVLDPRAVVAEASTFAVLPDWPSWSRREPVRLDTSEAVADGTDATIDPALGEDISIIQFTSGSMSSPNAVRLSADAVIAHIEMMRLAFRIGLDEYRDSWGSWLPMHHDMGLIGTLVAPVAHGRNLWLLRPEQFVRRPLLWLEMFGRHGVNHSGSPNFALERVVRLVRPNDLTGMDFSTWRTLSIGSDRINLGVLRALYELLAPFGLRPQTLMPGYGMAEATVGVSTSGPEETPHALLVDGTKLRHGGEVSVLARETLDSAIAAGPDEVRVVGCGAPLPGARILVADENGELLPDRRIGELVVESPAMFSGYLRDETPARPADGRRRHYTGDLGFLCDGQVYVLGRMGNSVKINGNILTAEDVEIAVADRLDLPHDKVIAILRDLDEPGAAAALLIFHQSVPPERVEAALAALNRLGLPSDRAALAVMPPRGVPRTTSGKPRRVELWRLLETGAITAKVCHLGARSPLRESWDGGGPEARTVGHQGITPRTPA
ncbi:AMP-binding protein [Nocardia transvalensis]|uniref:AMP-binding protein n=1 Tax=Nocardia transvalensis TaxID=37333 RepID=UPI00189306F2|nr:AMP-binding protein [Nocardia transvalensis]MBF6331943.1 AMP-binding protein [Nocardia transvalensis]